MKFIKKMNFSLKNIIFLWSGLKEKKQNFEDGFEFRVYVQEFCRTDWLLLQKTLGIPYPVANRFV